MQAGHNALLLPVTLVSHESLHRLQWLARCRAPTTAQRDVKRARIVLLAAAGRSTGSIAEEVGVQPRVVSNWRYRFADHGLGGLVSLYVNSDRRLGI